MEKLTCQVLPFEIRSGAENMAADEVLLQNARPGLALLRFYAWSAPTISLGYFQPATVREPWPNLPFVRRSTGGGMLLHDHELTYAVALTVREKRINWLRRMHCVIADGLWYCGVVTRLVEGDVRRSSSPLCFHQFAAEDVMCRGSVKIVGSAQRKQGNRLLQHGGILLAQSEHTPELPGVLERAGISVAPALLQQGIERALQRRLSWRFERRGWSSDELGLMRRLTEQKYSQAWWNDKR